MNGVTSTEPLCGRTTATLLVFTAVPVLAALGPVLTIAPGLSGYRLACVLIIAHALLFLIGRQPWSWPDRLLAAAALCFVVSGLAGVPRITQESDNPYGELAAVTLGLLTALALRAWQRQVPGIFLAIARGWVLGGLLSCGYALWENRSGVHLPGYLTEAAPAPAASFGNPNALAIYVVMATVWAVPVWRCGGRGWRLVTYLLLAACPPVLIYTDARLAMGVWAFVVGCAVWFGVSGSRSKIAYGVAAVIPVAAAAALLAVWPVLAGYWTESAATGTSGSVRVVLTVQGLELAAAQRGLPTWPGAFESLMTTDGDLTASGGLVNAHNSWVEMEVQYGLLSLLLLWGWMIASVAGTKQRRGEAAVAVVTLLALGVVSSSSLDDGSFWFFMVTLAASTRGIATLRTADARHVRGSTGPSAPTGAPLCT